MARRPVILAAAVLALSMGGTGFALLNDSFDPTFGSASMVTGTLGESAAEEGALGDVLDLGWDALIPDGYDATALSGTVLHEQVFENVSDGSTALDDAFAEGSPWQEDTDTSAVRAELDGRVVRIAGYMTPLNFEDAEIGEFLLVPYVGACVHVPPPSANQIVYVEIDGTVPVLDMWQPFYAVGTLSVEATSTELAEVGYSMKLQHIELYEEPEVDVYDDTQDGEST